MFAADGSRATWCQYCLMLWLLLKMTKCWGVSSFWVWLSLVWTCAGGVWILGYNGDISIRAPVRGVDPERGSGDSTLCNSNRNREPKGLCHNCDNDCWSLSNYHFQNLVEGSMEDKDCFCGGLVKFSEMLTSVEVLLCGGEDEGRTAKLAAGGKN